MSGATCSRCGVLNAFEGRIKNVNSGSEVARYPALHLPDFLKEKTSWKEGDYQKALDEAFLEFDELLRFQHLRSIV